MKPIPYSGQKLKIPKSDYIIVSEEWIVETVEFPAITFSCKKWWDYNSITMQGQTSETVVGNIVKIDDQETIVAFSQYSGIALEVGLSIRGEQATFLKRLDPPEYA